MNEHGSESDVCACVDDDECESSTHRCHSHATCYNTRGSYKCDCNEGFTGNGFNCEGSASVHCFRSLKDKIHYTSFPVVYDKSITSWQLPCLGETCVKWILGIARFTAHALRSYRMRERSRCNNGSSTLASKSKSTNFVAVHFLSLAPCRRQKVDFDFDASVDGT